MSERFLVTGALGCIGSWACRQLVREGADVIALDAGGSDHRLRQILEPDELAGLARVDCDITDLTRLSSIVADGVTHVVHLAALQVPFCRANPSLGASVNVVGTVNVFEAARRRANRMAGLSSVGVRPMTVYGVGRDQGMTSGPTKAIVSAVLEPIATPR